jgi:hypothetical protein
MVNAQLHKAETGDTQAFNAVMDRVLGRPGQRVEMSVTSTNANFTAFAALPQAELEALSAALENAVNRLEHTADAEQSAEPERTTHEQETEEHRG